ncbi:MAG: lipopolysaccharide biosynthesis protein [Stellaceae bacterium]
MGRQLLVGVAVQAAVYIQSLVLFPIVIRHAGATTYGDFVVQLTLLYLLFGLYASGVPYRYRRELVSTQTPGERRALFGPQFAFQLVCVAVVSAAIVVWTCATNTGSSAISRALPLIAWIVANTFYRLVADYFRYTLRMGIFNFLTGVPPYLFLVFVVSVVFARGALSVDRLIVMQAASFALPALLPLGKMLREIGLPRPTLRWRTIVADFKQGAPLTLELVIDFLLASSDRLLIAAFLSLAAVGSYQPAYTLGMLVIFLPRVFDAIMLPNLNRLIDRGKIAEAESLIQVMLNLLLLIALPFAAASFFIAPTLLRVLTNAEIASASRWVTPVVACAAICYGAMLIAGQVAFALRRTRAIAVANASGGAINVILNLLLLPVFASIVLPAVTTLIGYAVGLALTAAALRRYWRFRIDRPGALRCAVAAAAMILLLYQLGYRPGVFTAQNPVTLAASIAAGVVVYFAVLWVSGVRIRDFSAIFGYPESPEEAA